MEYYSYVDRFTKIYPFLKGFTDDLLFFIAIDTLFFTIVKGLSVSEISLLTAISSLFAILGRLVFLKLISRIGNTVSVRIGMFLLLLSAIVMTLGTNFWVLLLGKSLYEIAFIFKDMEIVLLKNNLSYIGQEKQYAKIVNKSMVIYAFLTFIVALSSGVLFNIHPYLPMFLCIFICIIAMFFYLFLKDVSEKKNLSISFVGSSKIGKSNSLWILFLCYGLFFGLMTIGIHNSKLLIQYELANIYQTAIVSFYLSLIIALSRISRLVSMVIYGKIYERIKEKVPLIFTTLLCSSFLLILIGYFCPNPFFKFICMTFGFCFILSSRDPFRLYMQDVILTVFPPEYHQRLISYTELARKIGVTLCGFLISMILFRWSLICSIWVILFLSLCEVFIAVYLYRILNTLKKHYK